MADIAFREDALSAPRISRHHHQKLAGSRWEFRVDNDLAAYERASMHAIFAPAQSPEWIEAWAKSGTDIIIARVHAAQGQCVLALALEVVRTSSMCIARYVGHRHANGNFPLSSYESIDRIEPGLLDALLESISTARPDIDLVSLERMSHSRAGKANPFLALNHQQSANIALAADLTDGFDALVARTGGSSKWKKHRRQVRKFSESGEVRMIYASTAVEVDRLLTSFFEMKAERFAALGIDDPFAPMSVRAAFRNLFSEALSGQVRLFTLEGLEIGGKLRAVSGHSHDGARLVCEFCAFANDELSNYSPGSYLFFEVIKKAAENDYRLYDFSVGDEPYKRQWCDAEIKQFDVVVPLTLRGRIAAAGLRAGSSAKRWLKSQPHIWQQAKRLRQIVKGNA
ncbi:MULTISPECIES: GNAT family N-acetyltransferase [Mesorhizobium]|uniref:GNAT family N-acetyltransferase n=1 Tax=Mesorhizobium denitrificans TaxID=2294114 RepID=A0A371X936_9HYPH|nr:MULTISPECIES: GNAT family N-acetyltransferase [Mesorhizobium]RFC65574.1 GNAT family N-acetyltransferase [Mesorhizobium denitrificans]